MTLDMQSSSSTISYPPPDEGANECGVQRFIKSKAEELFLLCDKESKGYINKCDLQLLQAEIPLTHDQLMEVFDSLDVNRNGFITSNEFCSGFGGFFDLSAENSGEDDAEPTPSFNSDEHVNDIHESERDAQLLQMIKGFSLDPLSDLNSEQVLFDALHRLHQSDHSKEIMDDFIRVIVQKVSELKTSKESLERTLMERSQLHENEVQHLYEEMEQQISDERRKILAKEVAQEREKSVGLQDTLARKQEQLEELASLQSSMEQKFADLSAMKEEAENESSQLSQLNQSLVEELRSIRSELEDARSSVNLTKQQNLGEGEYQDDDETRMMDLEKTSLLRQLEVMRELNRRLRDENDEVIQQAKIIEHSSSKHTSTPKEKPPLLSLGSNLGKYFSNATNGVVPEIRNHHLLQESGDKRDVAPIVLGHGNSSEMSDSSRSSSPPRYSRRRSRRSRRLRIGDESRRSPDDLRRSTKSIHDELMESRRSSDFIDDRHRRTSATTDDDGATSYSDGRATTDENRECSMPQMRAEGAGVGGSGNFIHGVSISVTPKVHVEPKVAAPDRVYKVVFIGNSGVGKTSFIHQYVSAIFSPSIASTIGVDYQVKTLTLDGQTVALQLWDTAGQERYRSITRQYFRKADGIIIMYDVTDEKSFLAVRNWMQSVQEGADPTAVVLLLGNKSDEATAEARQVMQNEGSKLAEEYGAKFFETSAKSSLRVHESMRSLSSDLVRLEEEQRGGIISLTQTEGASKAEKLSACCMGHHHLLSMPKYDQY